ncbi:nucleoid-associated protein [Thiocapsa rosea]|nr:nucleoid-associated protein [Thiocapsa rosea]
MPIKHIIIHEISKEPSGAATMTLRQQENPVNEHAERVSSELAGLFKAVNIGGFHRPESPGLPGTRFELLLDGAFDGRDFSDFVGFSHAASELLSDELNSPQAQQAKGGYLLLNHSTHQEKLFLSVVLLRMRQGITLADDLSFTEVDELNLDTLHMAARINLTDWRTEASERYIAFKIGRQAKDVTHYFSNFIGCRDYTAAKADTRSLVSVTRDFCVRRNLSESETLGVRRHVEELCRERLAAGAPVLLEDISNLLDARYPPQTEEDGGLFLTIAQEDYGLTNSPAIDKTALRALVRFSGNTKKLAISFDADLLGSAVRYDRNTKSLTIMDLPDNLIDDLEKTTG